MTTPIRSPINILVKLYLDESGDSTGYSTGSSSTFSIAILKVTDNGQLKSTTKRFCAKQIKNGWPRRLEVKASALFGAGKNPCVPATYKFKNDATGQLTSYLESLADIEVRIDYITVKKANVAEKLRTAPPFVLYNYLAGILVGLNARSHRCMELYFDAKNKETKPKLNFTGYIKTIAHTKSRFNNLAFAMLSCDSSSDYCIRAADFCSWAIFRKYESGDSRFFNLLSGKFEHQKVWFYT